MTQKICQSCAMPLTSDEILGTNADGSKNGDYCIYCMKDGNFTSEASMEEMIEFCVPICVKEGVYPDADTARKSMNGYFPQLKRWIKD